MAHESGCKYFKSFAGILKVLEFIVLLVAVGAVGYFLNEIDFDFKKKDEVKLFLAAAAVVGLLVVLIFLAFISGLAGKLKVINWSLMVVILFGLLSILLLVASALLAEAVQYYEDNLYCGLFKFFTDEKAQCTHLIIGTVCGFIAAALLVIDVVVHYRMYKSS